MINNIKIQGYKSIKDLDFELKPINILIGSNGVGKSNFISFFKLVNNIYEKRLENYSYTNGSDNLLYFGKKVTEEIFGYLEFDETNAYSFTLNSTTDNKLFIKVENVYFNRRRVYGQGGWNTHTIAKNVSESLLLEKGFRIAEYVKYYLRSFKVYHFHDTSENAPLRSVSKIEDNRYLKENGSNLASFLYYLKLEHPINYKRIENIVTIIAPFFEKFYLEPRQLAKGEIKLEWIDKKNPEKYFDASHLSDGTLRFIALATLLLQPELPKTILIDEPELGLHPVAVNMLAGMLKSVSDKGCQVIVSTQSINLVNNFEPEDIITVDRDGEQSVFSRVSSQSLKEWLDDYSMGELWAKSIISGQP